MNSTCAAAAKEEEDNPGEGSDKWASANYCIDSDGNIGLMVEEKYRALTSANNANDRQAVTIEVVNCAGEPDWPVSDKAFEALIKLCVDICKRNNIKKLNYTGDASGNLTRHDFFIERTCPGPYLGAKFPEIASRVNDILELNGDGLIYEPRLSLTEDEAKSLKYYNSENPFGAVGTGLTGGFGLPNCTAYAWGRWYELFDKYNKGTKPEYLSHGNAEDWYPYNKNLSSDKQYPYGSEPKLGSIVCYNDPVEDKGHVAIVEKITKKDNGVIEIETSNSGYGDSSWFFYLDTGSSNGKWCSKARDRYEFQGFIYLPFTF